MEQFKPAQVIILPAKDNTILKQFQLWKGGTSNNITQWVFKDEKISLNEQKGYCIPQHLYIISNDEIKEGDWYLHYDKIYQAITSEGRAPEGVNNLLSCKKIISTTDTSLKTIIPRHNDFDSEYPLPQPSQQFIEKYIEEYNKGEVITDVLVEYEKNKYPDIHGVEFDLKINPKDNTITIKKLKDSWNKQEMDFELNNLLNKLLITNRDPSLVNNPDSNKISDYINNYLNS